jgi:phage shock protein E
MIAGAVMLASTGCGGTSGTADTVAPSLGAPAVQPAATGVRLVAPADAAGLLDAGGRVLLDLRTPEEYAEGHLEGSTLLDFYAEDFRAQLEGLDRSAGYVIYCRSGNRSGQARAMMAELGFSDVADVDGGILSWTAAGLPVAN